MAEDVKMFVACNHVYNDKIYEIDLCPKCVGKGFYFDIYFNEKGVPALASSTSKLQQELIKVILEEKRSNRFHPNWGCELNERVIGTKNDPHKKVRIEMLVRESINHLMGLQVKQQVLHNNLEDDEVISSIQNIIITENGPDSYNIEVVIEDSSGEIVNIAVSI